MLAGAHQMTPNVSAVIEETIRLQQQTNHLQLLCMILIFASNIFIVLAVLSIRKATRVNRDWSKANQEWSAELAAAAQAIEAQRAGTTKIGPVADESAVAESDAPTTSPSSPSIELDQ